MENPTKTTSLPRVAQQKRVTQACDWRDVTSNDDSFYEKPRAKANKAWEEEWSPSTRIVTSL